MSDRGFIDWKPRGESKDRLDMAQAIIAEYQEFLPLTLRQVFYRAVGQYGYDKSEPAYKRLGYTLAKARRRGFVSMSAIRDDGVTVKTAPGFDGLDHFERYLKGVSGRYCREKQSGQDCRLILLCEAGGMVPQLAAVAHPFGVEVRSSGGYDSVTAKYELASEIIDLDRPVTLLHVGDLDPSGEDMFSVISEDVAAFVRHMTTVEDTPYGSWKEGNAEVEAVRIAVTRKQAIEMELPTAPAKKTDSRSKGFEGETVQCEAIPPNALNQIVKDAILSRLNMEAFEENMKREQAEKQIIDDAMERFSFREKAK